jgi:hypothetical protein
MSAAAKDALDKAAALRELVLHGACAGATFLGGLPRLDKSLAAVPRDWAALPSLLTTCYTEGADTVCMSNAALQGMKEDEFLAAGSPKLELPMGVLDYHGPVGWISVGQSYGMYTAVCGAMAIVSLVFLVGFLTTKLVCCCRRSVCKVKAPEPKVESAGRALFCQLSGLFCVLFFTLWVLGYAVASNDRGNKGLTETMKVAGTQSSVGLAELLAGLPLVARDGVEMLGRTTLPSVYAHVGHAITDSFDLGQTKRAVVCVADTIDLFGPAKMGEFYGLLDDVNASLSAFPDFGAMATRITAIDTTVQSLGPILADLASFIAGLKTALLGLDVAAIKTGLDDLDHVLSGDLAGNLTATKTALQAMKDNLPAGADVGTCKADLSAFESNPTTATANACVASQSALKVKLNAIPTGVNVTVANLQTVFATAVTVLDGLVATFSAAEGQITALPSGATVVAALQPLQTALAALDFSGVKGDLAALGAAVALLPRSARVQPVVGVVGQVADQLPCILSLLPQIASLNGSLVKLPGDLDFSGMLVQVNETVRNATGNTDQMTQLFRDLDSQIDRLPNTSAYTETLDGFEATLNDTLASLDVGDQMATIDASKGSFNVSDVTAKVRALKTQLAGGLPVTGPQLTDLGNFDDSKAHAITAIDGAVAAINTWTSSSAPKAGVCMSGGSAGQECGPSVGSQPCLSAICSWEATSGVVQTAILQMDALATNLGDVLDLTPVIANIDQASSKIAGVPAMDTSPLDDLENKVGSFAPKVDGYVTTIRDTNSSLAGSLSLLNIADAVTHINTAATQIDDARGKMDTYYGIVDGLNTSLASIQDKKAMVDGLEGVLVALADLFNEPLSVRGHALLANLSGTKVADAIKAGGIYGGAELVAWTLDNIVNEVYRPVQALLKAMNSSDSSSTSTSVGVADDNFSAASDAVVQQRVVLDAMQAASNKDFSLGHLNYVMRTIQQANLTASTLWTGEDFDAYRAQGVLGLDGVYAEGALVASYADDGRCLLDECIVNQVDIINKYPYNGLPMARESAWSRIFIFPILVVLLGILAFACSAAGRSCSSPLVACSCGLAFLLYMLAAGVLPMVLVFSDVCDNIAPLSASSIKAVEPTLCLSLFNVSAVTDARGSVYCVLNVSGGQSLHIDLDATVESLLGDCSAASWANVASDAAAPEEPVKQLWKRVGEVARPIAKYYVDKATENNTVLGTKALELMDQTSGDMADLIKQLAEGLSGPAGCAGLGAVLSSALDPVCCSLRTSLFFLIAPWFMIAIGISSCVLPIICCTSRPRRNVAKVAAYNAQVLAEEAKAKAKARSEAWGKK